MLFHMSIAAHDPRRVADVIAEMWGGDVFFFPPVTDGSWLVLAGDDRGTTMEIYPIDTVLREGAGDADAYGERTGNVGFTASHAAIATELDQQAVLAIADREGWSAKYRKRGGLYGVIELWVEGRQMIEVLTPEMQAEYRTGMTRANWQRMMKNTAAAAPEQVRAA
jgi:hypothetical protein